MVNNKTHLTTKMSPFIVNYGKELRIKVDIRKKEKVEKAIKFVERIKKIQEEVEVLWQPLDTRSNDNTSGKALS